MIIEYEGKRPRIAQTAFIAPTAVIIGDVTIGENSSVWFGAVLRGDEGRITVGQESNIQDNVIIHTTEEHATILCDRVTVGHGAILEGCTVNSGTVIGMGAVVLEAVIIGEGALIGAGAVVTRGAIIPPRSLALGVPAVVQKELSLNARQAVESSALIYYRLAQTYRQQT